MQLNNNTISSTASSDPCIWLITAYRAGEREQLLALAETLGWPFQIKEVTHRKHAWRTNLLRGSDLSGINPSSSSPLEPPWPDLILSAGMRNEPVCRWIRLQSDNRARIVHIGRPWADPDRFDLVITTPQYRLAERPNVLQNTTTLHRVTTQRLQQASRSIMIDVPQPFVALIVGGNSGPYTFGRKAARRLAAQANAFAEKKAASLLVSTSARTSVDASQELARFLRVPAQIYYWQENDKCNPYFAFLELADDIIVTADSISMLTEACATRKPVYMFDLATGRRAMRRQVLNHEEASDFRFSAETYHWLMQIGPKRLSRDIRLVHDRLIDEGRAVWLGDSFPDKKPGILPDLGRAVQRVRQLLEIG